mmetsp:Transcript_2351/g.6381  ORF Transcript_2351/g.6381 Transcript_2351/m.6381 type:complete len:165 (+) Transcript_2351:640-1134(+)
MVNVDSNSHKLSFESDLTLSKLHTDPEGSPHVVVVVPNRNNETKVIEGASVMLHSERFEERALRNFLEKTVHKGKLDRQVVLEQIPSLMDRNVRKKRPPQPSLSREKVPPPSEKENTKHEHVGGRQHLSVDDLIQDVEEGDRKTEDDDDDGGEIVSEEDDEDFL